MGNAALILSLLILPILGGVVSYMVRPERSGLVSAGFALAILLNAVLLLTQPTFGSGLEVTWFEIGKHKFGLGLWYDQLSAVMTLVVAIVALCVSVFSIEYMKHDPAKNRYFALLGLFAFSMYGIVLSSNLLLTFIFWELVGFSSYLLIGFWFADAEPPKSAFKAFILNRIGDGGFLLAIFIAFVYFGTLNIEQLKEIVTTTGLENVGLPGSMLFLLGFGLFLAAVGKSAQFPLQTWLPDAMTGPTPVSALIHAATMVAAGVYLMVRIFPLLAPDVLYVIAIAGGITAFVGAFSAFAQNDIKKVLAYSTVSQLGYMIMAIGSGYPGAGFFHLVTHAFFKAGLFLCAGSIIHYFHENFKEEHIDGQDIRNMGGLRKALPVTFWVFTICMLSLSGIPLFSGYLSKDLIVLGVASSPTIPFFVKLFSFASVFMTAAYMSRLYFLVFFGEKHRERFRESLWVKLPLVLLSALSIWIVYVINPIHATPNWLLNMISPVVTLGTFANLPTVPFISVGLAISGLFISFLYIERHLMELLMELVQKIFYRLSRHHFYIDLLYRKILATGIVILGRVTGWIDKHILDFVIDWTAKMEVIVSNVVGWFDRSVVDGFVNVVARFARFLGNRTRSIQGGSVQGYFIWALLGVLLIFYYLN